jgi:hypothetical protein
MIGTRSSGSVDRAKGGTVLPRAKERLSILGLLLIPLGCAPLPQAGPPGEGGAIAVEDLPSTDVVPLSWGSLVSAYPMSGNTSSALWFQDDSGTVRLVGFDHRTQRLWAQAGVLRRR